MPLKMLLKSKFQLEPDEALNGAVAVEKFVANRNKECSCGKQYRLILMDINMPVMDGYTATQHILEFQEEYEASLKEENREREAKGKPVIDPVPLKIVAITSYTNKANIDQCFEVGMTEVIHKPVSLTVLQDIVDRYYY